ncbi:rubrerythrin family protein [Sediminibacterium sp.]|jgi:rubrerythrin|uniref:rubrerythrin family protein n=1 Tax=Sediminibacterium sp. TaxID=1917865 RepID=UPI0011DB3F6D|nr:rubrerythrin family protein [Sediminibacterium sp.]MDP3393523.1 rubrerythrin family protein [Sediminibacterium sp.]MDP3566706.1 rubrerythrin family protein [Sediminibacterium sp.]TXT31116.1 MAG: rubrerythrin [Chitinophagaceae bacterium]
MKKLLIIPVTVLAAGSIFLASCGSNNTDAAMKAPVQNNADTATQKATKESGENEGKENEAEENEKDEKTTIAKPASYVTNTDAKTTENMQAAFKGETTASAKYAAYSKKAEQEGYHQIALLFKAASTAENIHAKNHKAVLQESGVSVPVIKPEFTVKTTKENLQDAITGETYEVTTMYPEFLTAANEAGNQLAMISLNYAYKTEKKHKVFYEAALTALQNNTVNTLSTVFYVCPTCGNTYETIAPARCGISMTGGEKFIKITSL